ncbi:MAG: glycosyltransferase family 4 protein [bacterium]|nr:glycosyltransferase family 4 protein [bacterium]
MKIGIVSESYYPAVGGIPEHIHNLAVHLRQRGHTVKIVTTSYGEYADAPFNSPDVIRVGKSFNFHKNGSQSHVALGWGLSKQLRGIFSREQFDVLHIHGPEQPMLAQLALVNSNTVNVGTFHATYDRSFPLGICRPIVAVGLAQLHKRIVVSSTAQQTIQRYFPEGEYITVPNGVDVNRFAAGKPIPQYADRPNILFVGNFVVRKGFVNLLEAFLRLRQRMPEVRLLAVGDGKLRRVYEKQLAHLVGRDVIFTGRVPAEQLPSYYASASVYCSPSTGRESFGIVLIEAMAAGAPIVSSDIAGYRTVLDGTGAALTFSPTNINALTASLERVIRDRMLAQQMVQAGKRAVDQYRWSNVAHQVERVYTQARQAYPVAQPVLPGWRWLARFVPSRRKAKVRVRARLDD